MKKRFFKWGLLFLALALTWAGCSNPSRSQSQAESVGVVDRGSEDSLEVLLPSTATEGRSLESTHVSADPHYFDDVTVYLRYASEQYFTYAWTEAEIIARRKLIPAAGIPTLMFVAVDGQALDNGQFATIAAFNAAYDSTTVASQNLPVTLASNDNKGNLAGLYGLSKTAMIFGSTTTTIIHPTLPETRQAAVALASAVSRFELGKLKAANPAQLTSLTIDSVAVNKYYTDIGAGTTVNIAGTIWEANKPATTHWSRDTGNDALVTSEAGTQCYAFQIFPELIPHFIYEVSGTLAPGIRLADGTTDSFSGKYISIAGFTQFTGAATPNPHTIYKVGLTDGGIPINVINITDMPEVGANALEVVITITPWTEATITPEIFTN